MPMTLVTVAKKPSREMRSDEAGDPGENDLHALRPTRLRPRVCETAMTKGRYQRAPGLSRDREW